MIRTPILWPAILLGALIVVDGDTIALDGKRYRLLGFDTPETYHARCQAEYDAGIAASGSRRSLPRAPRCTPPGATVGITGNAPT